MTLERHSLPDLERAAIELQSHIRARRPKRSRIRQILSLSMGLGFAIFGGYLIITNLEAGRIIGMFSWFGVSMFVTGMMIVYSDFEG
jgi:uncharacterized membrane protein YgdD (TMEM256/DUF423 family)